MNLPDAEVGDGDPVRPFLLASNEHDGSNSLTFGFTAIRVVCMNTLQWAIKDGEQRKAFVKAKHTKNINEAAIAIRDTIDIARRTFNVTIEQYRSMRARNLDIVGLQNYVREVLEVPATQKDMPRAWHDILANFLYGAGHEKAGHTVWGAYNAVTEWLNHQRGRTEETRQESVWFGPSKETTKRAHDVAVAMSA